MTTNNQIPDAKATDSEIQMLIDSHEKGTAMFLRVESYYLMAKELQERRKADSAGPVMYQTRTRPTWNASQPWSLWSECSAESYKETMRFTIEPDGAGWVYEGRILYTAPPAPVVPDECKDAPAYVKALTEEGAYIYGWNACRAAMLQDAETVSNSDELPLDYLQGHKDGLEWAAQLEEANHPQTGDWLYDDPIDLALAIRKGPDMPPVQTASVVDADDNFYSWFGREWHEHYQRNQYTTAAKQMLGVIAESARKAGRCAAMLKHQSSNHTSDSNVSGGEIKQPSSNCTIGVQDFIDAMIQDGDVSLISEGEIQDNLAATSSNITHSQN